MKFWPLRWRKTSGLRLHVVFLFLVAAVLFSLLSDLWHIHTRTLVDTPGALAGDFLCLPVFVCVSLLRLFFCPNLTRIFKIPHYPWYGAYSTADCMHVSIYALWIVWNAYILTVSLCKTCSTWSLDFVIPLKGKVEEMNVTCQEGRNTVTSDLIFYRDFFKWWKAPFL